MSYLLCVDPGHANAGAAVIESSTGSVIALRLCETRRHDQKQRWRYADDQARRTQELARFYHGLMTEFSIKRLLVELPIGGAPNSQAATDLARASTVLVAVAEVHGCAMEWYSPSEVKRAATGRANASKLEVMTAIDKIYNVAVQFPRASQREHICDALGVWLAGRTGALARL